MLTDTRGVPNLCIFCTSWECQSNVHFLHLATDRMKSLVLSLWVSALNILPEYIKDVLTRLPTLPASRIAAKLLGTPEVNLFKTGPLGAYG